MTCGNIGDAYVGAVGEGGPRALSIVGCRRRRSEAERLCLFGVACNKNAIRRLCSGRSRRRKPRTRGRRRTTATRRTAVLESSWKEKKKKTPLHQTSTKHSELIISCFFLLLFSWPPPLFCGVETKRRYILFLVYFFCTYVFTSIVRSKI